MITCSLVFFVVFAFEKRGDQKNGGIFVFNEDDVKRDTCLALCRRGIFSFFAQRNGQKQIGKMSIRRMVWVGW